MDRQVSPRPALEAVALGLLEDHLQHCVKAAAAEGGPVAAEKIAEASAAIARLVRSQPRPRPVRRCGPASP